MRGLSDRGRILFLLAIMAVVAVITAAMSIWLLYQTALDERRSHLVETAQSQARLIEAVARFDAKHSQTDVPGGAIAATLSQITDAHEKYRGFGETGEFTLARREADKIVFLLSHRHYDLDAPNPVPWESNLAEPMRRALSGQSGTVIGLDYRNVMVLGAYEPVGELGLGIVAKVDMAEVRRPFLEAAGLSGLGVILIIVLGAVAGQQIGTPFLERLKAEEALRESEARFRAVVNHSPTKIHIKNVEGRYTLINPLAERLFGVTSEEGLGKTTHDLFEKDVADAFTAHDQTVMESGKAMEKEEEFVLEDGVHTFITTKFPIFDQGKAIAIGAIGTDITERKAAERRLEEREARLDAIMKNVADGIITIDEHGLIESLNPIAQSIFGYSVADLLGKNVSVLMPGPDRDEHDGYIRAYLETGIGKIIGAGPREVTARRKDGSTFPLEITVGAMRLSDRPAFVAAMRDITERRQVEQAVRESEERLRRITDSLPLIVTHVDTELRYRYANKKHLDWHGLRFDDIEGKTVTSVLGEVAMKVTGPRIAAALAGETVTFEADVDFATVGKRYMLVTYVPDFDVDGKVVGIYGTHLDLTDRKRTEAQLVQAQKMEAIGQLTAGVAHDFNNMLAVIFGNTELLADELGADNPQLAAVLRAAERGAGLTQRLLAFSRKQVLNPKVINANDLIADITGLLRRTLEEHIDIEAVTSADLWNCEVDPAQLENALVNLALNARDAMPDGGKLTIETANVRLNDDYAATQVDVKPGQYVMLAVTDNGSGIPPKVREHVFEPFFTTKAVGAGSGLGLSMVYGFVKQSGGHMTIYSEQGEGTTIELYLPRSTETEAVDRKSATDEAPVARGETVLVVEDDPDVRTLAVTLLGSLGYQIMEAGTGAAALAQLGSTTRVNLLLTDVVLPGGMNGRELATEAERRAPGIKVLYMSGYTEDAIMHHGRLDADAELLQKPFRRADLAREVRRVLDSPSA